MLNRYIILFATYILLATNITGCTSPFLNNSAKSTKKKSHINHEKEIVISGIRSTKEPAKKETDLKAKVLKDKFNLVINIKEIPSNDFAVKASKMFASGDVPDYIENARPEWNLAEWTTAGYLKGFSQDDLQALLPDYLNLWSKQEWDSVYNQIRYTDHKVYYIVGKRPSEVNMAWLYRKEAFDKLGLTFPKTPEAMLQVMKTVKAKTGHIPFVPANPANSTPLFVFSGIFQMFGMPELCVREPSYVDPVTKEFVAYTFAEDKHREAIIYINKLYSEGLVWKEFIAGTQKQLNQFEASGNGYITWAYPQKINDMNSLYQAVAPDVNWVWAKDMPSSNPNKTIYKREPYQRPDGPVFSSGLSNEKLGRLLEYINWSCTDEGLRFNTFGIEGTTYEKVDGAYRYKQNIASPERPSGDKIEKYGFPSKGDGFIFLHPDYNKVYNSVLVELKNTFVNRPQYYFYSTPHFQYTEDEYAKLTLLETNINSVRDQYLLKFIVGQLDAGKSSDWKSYKDALNSVGLQEYIKIRTTAYQRALK